MTEFEFENSEAAEAFELMMLLFEDRIDQAGMSQLDLAIRQHASVRRLFIRVAHQYCALAPLIAARGHQGQLSLMEIAGMLQHGESPENVLTETMILPALKEAEAGEDQDEISIQLPTLIQPADLKSPQHIFARTKYRIAVGIAVALLVTVAVIATRRGAVQQANQKPTPAPRVTPRAVTPEPALATITAMAGAKLLGPDVISPRTNLVPGQILHLTGGAVELAFATGANVVVRGPAQVWVTDRNTLTVEAGSVYAHVPPSAIGFRILAPGLGVVDRGTNFGVRVAPGGSTSEVHVFEGRVDASALDGSGKPGALPTPLKAGDAVAHSASSPVADLKPVQFDAIAFDRDINRIQVEVPSHGTGAGLAAGSKDPQWQVISVPNAPDWKPVSAVVVLDPRPEYFQNSDKAKWISLSSHMDNFAGGDYVYRTSIDLKGLAPASVSVTANFAVDDNIREIRVNGRAVSLPAKMTLGMDRTLARTELHQVALSNVNWISGPNQIDVVVWNLTGYANFTALQLSWNISASPVVIR